MPMQEKPKPFVATQQQGAYVVKFDDRRILDEVSIFQIGEDLRALAATTERPRMVLDFSQVEHMSSAALGMLITLHKWVREREGQLRLCSIRPEIYQVFVITKLNEIFQIHDGVPAALESFR
jgi:anti-sigma B factor antagonist